MQSVIDKIMQDIKLHDCVASSAGLTKWEVFSLIWWCIGYEASNANWSTFK